eukprot:c7877_g1_i2.p1 GENE.c7877_g1_i2~~c7877_g1_i2.p1  ORF type:complete len:499 (+),score=52.57 c7877_g1_i2:1156-2652(+)
MIHRLAARSWCLVGILDTFCPWLYMEIVHIVNACLNQSKLWGLIEKFYLTINERVLRSGNVVQSQVFCDYLLRIGSGKEITPHGHPPGTVELPKATYLESNNINDLIEVIFPDIDAITHPYSLCERAILTPWNESTLDINDRILQRLPGREAVFCSADSVDADGNDSEAAVTYPVGAIYLLLRNLNPKIGLFNGTRVVVNYFRQHVIVVKIASGSFVNIEALIPRITFTSTETALPFILSRRQFPLFPAFAMTINKSQGQTLEKVGIYLPRPILDTDSYMLLCRCTSLRGLKIMISSTQATRTTTNVVFDEALDQSVQVPKATNDTNKFHFGETREDSVVTPATEIARSNSVTESSTQQSRSITPSRRKRITQARGGATLAQLRLIPWLSQSVSSSSFSWLFMPVILDALNMGDPAAARPSGWQKIVHRYRDVFVSRQIDARNVGLSSTKYLPGDRQRELLALDDVSLTLLEVNGQRVRHAFQSGVHPPDTIDLSLPR